MPKVAAHSARSPAPIEPVPRRSFFQRFGLWTAGVLGFIASLSFAIPFVGYLLGPRRKRPVVWKDLGTLDKFLPVGETRLRTFQNPLGTRWDGVTGQTGVYVRYLGKDQRNKDQFLVFAVNCAHLGCPVTWFPQSGLFMCPCHGGVYYENGEHASGPPPRGLFQCEWRVIDGRLEIQAPHYPTLHNTLRAEA